MKKLLTLFVFIGVLSCNVKDQTLPNFSNARISNTEDPYNNEKWGQFFYKHLKNFAVTVDPYTYVEEGLRNKLRVQFDSLKNVKQFDYNLAFDKALAKNKISKNQHTFIKQYIKDLLNFKIKKPKKTETEEWFRSKESEIKSKTDLTISEKDFILTLNSIYKYYYKNKYDDLADDYPDLKKGGGRIAASNSSDDCDELCPLTVISTYIGIGAAVGSTAGPIGAVVGGIFGVLTLFFTPDLCDCSQVCTYTRGISITDECYNPSNGLKFKAFGYGNSQPEELIWYFYRDDLKPNPDVILSSAQEGYPFSEMRLKDSQIAGASRIGVKVISKCGNNYLNSINFGWYNIADLGKPRFIIYNLDGNNPNIGRIGQESYFGIMGANYRPVTWSASFTYATILQNGTNGENFIVRWNNRPPGTTQISASATTACGSSTQTLNITTVNP